MQVKTSSRDGKSFIQLHGRFDFSSHREFRGAYDEVLRETGVRDIELDLGGVDYLDSSALGMLLLLRERAEAASKRVTLVNCRSAVRQVLDIANFGRLFPIR